MKNIEQHYHANHILQSILEGLTTDGKNIDQLNVNDLIAVDAFHLRGREATIELAETTGFKPEHTILDVGCGIGGSARFITDKYDCTVHGIDITQSYIETAIDLSKRAGFADKNSFQQASALELPFAAESFDFVWTEHVQMNIEDKPALYAEMTRVLKPGGCLLFHDVFQGKNDELTYPVPWAESAEISHLINVETAQQFLVDAGLTINHWQDKTEASLKWLKARKQANKPQKTTVSLKLLMGDNIADKITNIANNIQQENIVIVQCIARKN